MQVNYYVIKFLGQIESTNTENSIIVYREDHPKYKIPTLWQVEKVSFTEIINFAKENNCNICLYLVLSKCNKYDPKETRMSFKNSKISINEFISQQRKIQKELFQIKVKRVIKPKNTEL